ncbi:MAG: hypothetical protein K0S07_554 [Chlamydiales bacterium]|nr:hypothetical protein [Chlamydiales bacterium]
MGHIVRVNLREVDFESAVDEVDLIVPKYLAALDHLEKESRASDVLDALSQVRVYWHRLKILIEEIAPLETQIPFEHIMHNCLRQELAVLETVYSRLNARVSLISKMLDPQDFVAAEVILERMDAILEEGGLLKEHKDRLYLKALFKNLQHKKMESGALH